MPYGEYWTLNQSIGLQIQIADSNCRFKLQISDSDCGFQIQIADFRFTALGVQSFASESEIWNLKSGIWYLKSNPALWPQDLKPEP
jgi:hypothetical protein